MRYCTVITGEQIPKKKKLDTFKDEVLRKLDNDQTNTMAPMRFGGKISKHITSAACGQMKGEKFNDKEMKSGGNDVQETVKKGGKV